MNNITECSYPSVPEQSFGTISRITDCTVVIAHFLICQEVNGVGREGGGGGGKGGWKLQTIIT